MKLNPKSQALNPKQITNSNVPNSGALDFVLGYSDLFRIRDLEFRISEEFICKM